MSKEPNTNGTPVPPFFLPDAARILRVLWDSLNVELPKRTRESTRKYLNEERPLRGGVLRSMLLAVVDAGYLPSAGAACHDEALALIETGLAVAVSDWDHMVSHLRVLSSAPDALASGKRYLRFAAIDFAIRMAAIDILIPAASMPKSLSDKGTSVPVWALHNGVRNLLRELPKRLGITRTRLTGKQFEEFLDGRYRPSIKKIAAFAVQVAAHKASGASDGTYRFHLIWLFALDALSAELARTFGSETVEDAASGFRRLRTRVVQMLRDARARGGDEGAKAFVAYLRQLVVCGARADVKLIDRLVHEEAQLDQVLAFLDNPTAGADVHAVVEPYRAALPLSTWENDVRACHAPWILSEIFAFVSREPISMDDASPELLERVARAMADVGNPSTLADLCKADQTAFRLIARILIQQAFVRGNFKTVVPIVRKLAIDRPSPATYLDAAVIYVAAGETDEALKLLAAIEREGSLAQIAKPLIAVTHALSGRHAEALSRLEGLESDDTLEYARGVSLRGVGQAEDALTIFRALLEKRPGHVLALDQAARCCYDLSDASRSETQRGWTLEGNRYAREAKVRGRPVVREGRGTHRRIVDDDPEA